MSTFLFIKALTKCYTWQNYWTRNTFENWCNDFYSVFLVFSQLCDVDEQCTDRLTRKLHCRSRIMLRHKSRDQNTKIRKLKMADGRHFENGYIAISQACMDHPILMKFGNLCRCSFDSKDDHLAKKSKFYTYSLDHSPSWETKTAKMMNGDITLEARWHWRGASKVISLFIILLFSMYHVAVINCR